MWGGGKLWEALKALLLDQALLYFAAASKLCWIEGEAPTSPPLCPPSQFPPNATLLFPWVVVGSVSQWSGDERIQLLLKQTSGAGQLPLAHFQPTSIHQT